MSSYLNIYLVPKADNEEAKPLLLSSFTRNSHVYQYIQDNISISFFGMEDEIQYTELTKEDILLVINDIKKDIDDYRKRIDIYYKIKKSSGSVSEIVNTVIELEELIAELTDALYTIEFIYGIITDLSFSDFKKVVANID